jgi:hypothetical protein
MLLTGVRLSMILKLDQLKQKFKTGLKINWRDTSGFKADEGSFND